MKTETLLLLAAVGFGAYYLLKDSAPVLPPGSKIVAAVPKGSAVNLAGLSGYLGRNISCCRWINMGGWSAWVCGPGICRDGGVGY